VARVRGRGPRRGAAGGDARGRPARARGIERGVRVGAGAMSASFTVIVPTRDRPAQLQGCLEALDRQDYPSYEVVVVDDTRGEGPAAARNAGAERARGELLAFTDDACRPE